MPVAMKESEKKMKKVVLILVILALFAGCSAPQKEEAKVLKVGASPVPHGDILKFIQDDLKKEGYELEIVEFTDYVLPNLALEEGDLAANFFQHVPYLDNFNAERGTHLISAGGVHIEPIGLYSANLTSLDELGDKAQVLIPGDATNGGRSLLLLEKLGLIKLKQDVGLSATPQDIIENPKNLVFKEMEAAQIPQALEDADLAAINTNYVLSAGLDPERALVHEEGKDNPYANILAIREADKDAAFVKVLLKVLQSEKVKKFLEEEYKGAILPAF